MSFLSSTRITWRLGAGFALLLIMSVIIGGVGLTSATVLSDVAERFHDHPFTVIKHMGRVRVAFNRLRMSARDLLLAETPAEIDRINGEIEKYGQEFEQQIPPARAAFLGDQATFDESMTAYRGYRALLATIAVQMRTGDRAAARDTLRNNEARLSELSIEKNTAILTASEAKADRFMLDARDTRAALIWQMSLILGTIVLSGMAISLVIGRSITGPVGAMTDAMERLAAGDKSVVIPALDHRDEIGGMARAVKVFKENLLHTEQLEAAARDEQQRELRRSRQRELLTADFDVMIRRVITKVDGTVDSVHRTSTGLHDAAEQTSRQSATVTGAAELASANIQTVASAAEQLGASTQEISRRVQDTTRITQEAVEGVQTADVTIEGLSAAAQKIGEIVSLINDIASQTNLLALNATIEAARAGEAGKGFAVVANEVKHLATQTARATNEIAEQISGIQATTQHAVSAIKVVGGAITRVNEVVSSIAAAVEEQNAATQEIVRNVSEAAAGNSEVTRSITEVSIASNHTRDMASDMSRVAQMLEESGKSLGRHVETFLTSVKAV